MATNKPTKRAPVSKKIVASKKGKFNLVGWQKIGLIAVGVLALAGIAYAGLQVYENLSPSAASATCPSTASSGYAGTSKLYKTYAVKNSAGTKLSGTNVCIYNYKESKFKGDYVLYIKNASSRTMFEVSNVYQLVNGSWVRTGGGTSNETTKPFWDTNSTSSKVYMVDYPYVKYSGVWYHAKITFKEDSVSVSY